MNFTKVLRLQTFLLLVVFLLLTAVISHAAGLNALVGKEEINEEERAETIEKIHGIQEKLKLLQDKLRVLERRKAAEEAAIRAEKAGSNIPGTPVQINWVAISETTVHPGEYGLYTYLLFNGKQDDFTSIGLLEDFILTIETLPAHDIPSGLANQFLVPVEKPQSMINLGRQPYDFRLNQAFMDRLGIKSELPKGPVLVSSSEPVDPYGTGAPADYVAIGMGKQSPERSAALAGIWHKQEKKATLSTEHAVTELFWQLIDGIGPVQVTRNKHNVTVALPQ